MNQIIEYCQVNMRGCVWENDDILENLFFPEGFLAAQLFYHLCNKGEASVKYDLSMRGETGGGVLDTTVS